MERKRKRPESDAYAYETDGPRKLIRRESSAGGSLPARSATRNESKFRKAVDWIPWLPDFRDAETDLTVCQYLLTLIMGRTITDEGRNAFRRVAEIELPRYYEGAIRGGCNSLGIEGAKYHVLRTMYLDSGGDERRVINLHIGFPSPDASNPEHLDYGYAYWLQRRYPEFFESKHVACKYFLNGPPARDEVDSGSRRFRDPYCDGSCTDTSRKVKLRTFRVPAASPTRIKSGTPIARSAMTKTPASAVSSVVTTLSRSGSQTGMNTRPATQRNQPPRSLSQSAVKSASQTGTKNGPATQRTQPPRSLGQSAVKSVSQTGMLTRPPTKGSQPSSKLGRPPAKVQPPPVSNHGQARSLPGPRSGRSADHPATSVEEGMSNAEKHEREDLWKDMGLSDGHRDPLACPFEVRIPGHVSKEEQLRLFKSKAHIQSVDEYLDKRLRIIWTTHHDKVFLLVIKKAETSSSLREIETYDVPWRCLLDYSTELLKGRTPTLLEHFNAWRVDSMDAADKCEQRLALIVRLHLKRQDRLRREELRKQAIDDAKLQAVEICKATQNSSSERANKITTLWMTIGGKKKAPLSLEDVGYCIMSAWSNFDGDGKMIENAKQASAWLGKTRNLSPEYLERQPCLADVMTNLGLDRLVPDASNDA